MYAPIDPVHGGVEPILRSLGAVLDAHLARGIAIRHRGSSLIVQAEVVASCTDRIVGTWSRFEHVISHVDAAQAQMATAARRATGHVPGMLERSLGRIGVIADEQRLRDLTLIQHPSGAMWLVWHTSLLDGHPALMLLSQEALVADDDLAELEPVAAAAADTLPHGLSSIRWRVRTVGHSPRPALGSMIREVVAARQAGSVLARAGGIAKG